MVPPNPRQPPRLGPGSRYTVRPGDTLWDLAARQLGDPFRWPEIYMHNNDPRIVALSGSRIADPDLIFVGQTLYLPEAAAAPAASRPGPSRPAAPASRSGGRAPAIRDIQSFPFKYSFEQLPEITIASPTHVATLKLTGSVTIQFGQLLDFVTFKSSGDIVMKMKREADLAFQKLVSDASVTYDPSTNRIGVSLGLTIHSDQPYAPSGSLTATISKKTGLPAMSTSISVPPIKGKVLDHLYVTENLGFKVEVSQRPGGRREYQPEPVRSPGTEIVLVVAAAALMIVGTALILEDAFPILGGPLNDPIAASAIGAALGLGVFKGQQINGGQPIAIPGGTPSGTN